MKTSNRIFKILDSGAGGLAILVLWFFSKVLGIFGFFHRQPKPQRILFSKFCCQGDALLSLYALRCFREQYPEVEMVMAVGRKTEDIYRSSNLFDRVVCLKISGKKGIREIFSANILSFLKELSKAGRFDTFVDMDLYFRFSVLTGFWIHAGRRIGFSTSKVRRLAFTLPVPRRMKKHEMECFYDLLAPLNIDFEEPRAFRFSFLESVRPKARTRLLQYGWNGIKPLVALLPGSSANWPAKRWPIHKFSKLILKILSWKEVTLLILGQREEESLGAFLNKQHPKDSIDLTGKTDFRLLTAILSFCSLFVGNDSGPMHLADMLGVPVVGLFGPTDEAKWRPRNKYSHTVINNNIDCRPCYYLSNMPDCKHQKCLHDISVEDVSVVAKKALTFEINHDSQAD